MRLGVFGGTFDPVHIGHLILAEEIRHALELETVLFVPAGLPPHKHGQAITPAEHRVAMLRLALAANPTFCLCLLDVQRGGPSYTADLLQAIQAEHPDAALYFIMGDDSLADLPSWHQPERIVAQARLAVAARPGVQADLAALETRLPGLSARLHRVPTIHVGISSRDIRARVAEGRPIRYQVPDPVAAYIRANALYRSPVG